MSSGGVFQLIANDGKADRMVMATELLRQRIAQVSCARAQMGAKDTTPTLSDIERTHILFMNAHFKPFAAIGYEYNKVQPQTGVPNYGAEVQFSIPQFGDFFHDMALNINISEAQITTTRQLPTLTASSMTNPNNIATSYRERYIFTDGRAASAYGEQDPDAPALAFADYLHYAEFPGMKLLELTKFEVNGNPLDQYTSDSYAFYQWFCVTPVKQDGWNKNTGQEVASDGYSALANDGPAGSFTSRAFQPFVHGAQTPKQIQPAQEWWVPLLFWFNLDVRLMIPSVSIPYGQRFITVKLATQCEILYRSTAGVWREVTTTTYNGDFGDIFGNSDDTSFDASTTVREWRPVPLDASTYLVLPTQTMTTTLYINNIFVNPEIHDIYIHRIGFTLIRVHRTQRSPLTDPSQNQLMSQFKYPIEFFFLGVRPQCNTTKCPKLAVVDATDIYPDITEDTDPRIGRPGCLPDIAWHRFGRIFLQEVTLTSLTPVDIPNDTSNATLVIPDTNNGQLDDGTATTTSVSPAQRFYIYECVPIVERIKVEAHAIPIYNDFPMQFFNSYLPNMYGGPHLKTPKDCGAMFVNFCLYPKSYQPSSHINISRAREFFIQVFAATVLGVAAISSTLPADLVADASALNFLLISDGSAVLRYST